MLVDLVAFLIGWAAGWWLLWRVPVPPGDDVPASRRGPVSIIVPARDEAAVIAELLASLVGELAEGDELIVVDDHSTDGTATVARSAGARVLVAPEVPEGWNPKSWACQLGAGHAGADHLVFLDADTRLEPGGLARLVATQRSTGGLYSVQPYHVVPRFRERLAAVFNVVALMGTGAFAPRRQGRASTGAFGPCLVTSTEDYHASGGFAAVSGAVLDDLALAGRYRDRGLPVTIHGGRGTIWFRMYPGGLGPLVEGFTKNFASAALAVPRWMVLAVTGWLVALCTPGVLAFSAPGWLAAACYLAAAAQLTWHLRRLGSFGVATALIYPLALAFFIAVFARSLVSTVIRGRVRWRGRDLATRPGRSRAR